MAKNKLKAKSQKSVAIRVINILFLIALVIAIVVPVLMFTPVSSSIKGLFKDKSWAIDMVKSMNSWVKYHICKVFHLNTSFRGHGVTFTSCFYLYITYFTTLVSLFMVYTPFLAMHRNKVKGKNQVYRKVLCWIAFGFMACVFASVASTFWSKRLANDLGSVYTWLLTLGRTWVSLFRPKGALNILVIERITWNYYMWSIFWLYVLFALIVFLLLLIACVGKAKKPVENKVAEEKVTEAKEQQKADEVTEETPLNTPAPVLAEEKEEITKITPTIREIALLNSLNPLYETKIDILPDLEDIEEAKPEVETVNSIALQEEKKNEEVEEQAEEINKELSPEERAVVVLPGIDEWNADPWPVEEAIDQSSTEDLTQAAKEEAEEEIKLEEVKTEVIEEEKRPDEQIEESEEAKAEEKEASKIVFINSILKDGKRPQEETNEDVLEENKEDRTSYKEILCDNSHTPVVTSPVEEKETWLLDKYELPKAVEEAKPVEEKPVSKPAPRVAPISLKQFDPSKKANRPIEPIKVINPITKEEPVEETKPVEEKKVPTPISGPLHSIAKSKHDKIEAVKPRKVPFSVKKYQVKTYEGELTAEQAFNMGVTKVQPTVNPVFANQTNEPAWKEKKRREDIRSNGYSDVTQVSNLNGKTTTTNTSSQRKATSIRDLIKSKKHTVENKEVKPEEKKIAKPITPIAFKPVEKKEEEEEAKPEEKTASPIKPIAPLTPKKRPDIKPIKPITPIKPKK